jgi:hypothetical protein
MTCASPTPGLSPTAKVPCQCVVHQPTTMIPRSTHITATTDPALCASHPSPLKRLAGCISALQRFVEVLTDLAGWASTCSGWAVVRPHFVISGLQELSVCLRMCNTDMESVVENCFFKVSWYEAGYGMPSCVWRLVCISCLSSHTLLDFAKVACNSAHSQEFLVFGLLRWSYCWGVLEWLGQ